MKKEKTFKICGGIKIIPIRKSGPVIKIIRKSGPVIKIIRKSGPVIKIIRKSRPVINPIQINQNPDRAQIYTTEKWGQVAINNCPKSFCRDLKTKSKINNSFEICLKSEQFWQDKNVINLRS
jgi:hypothetical protein